MKRRTALEELLVYGQLLEGVEFNVVNIHPLADQYDILERLNLSPLWISFCDLYWEFKGRLFFVSIGLPFNDNMSYISYHYNYIHRFTIKTQNIPVTKSVVNSVLGYLSDWIDNNNDILNKKSGKQIIITNSDIFD